MGSKGKAAGFDSSVTHRGEPILGANYLNLVFPEVRVKVAMNETSKLPIRDADLRQ